MKILRICLVSLLAVCFSSSGIFAQGEAKSSTSKTSMYDNGEASFAVSGAWQGTKSGRASFELFEANERHFMTITINDINETPDFILKLQVESWEELGLPQPGEYQLVSRSDADTGYAGGIGVTYTHILEYKGPGYYSNIALEYKAPVSWKGTPKGKIIIDSVDETYVYGSFELELWENSSINKAPLTGENVSLSNGSFKAIIVKI